MRAHPRMDAIGKLGTGTNIGTQLRTPQGQVATLINHRKSNEATNGIISSGIHVPIVPRSLLVLVVESGRNKWTRFNFMQQ
jgi:hypothetical protein